MIIKGQNGENLRELFEKFLSTEEAEQAAEDVRKGEQILRERPGPEPDATLVADIKVKIAEGLRGRKRNALKQIAYEAAAVAAVFVLLAVVSVGLFEEGGGEPEKLATASVIPKAIWESDYLTDDDANLATLIAEIEQIESETAALQFGENGDNGYKDSTELEIELMEIDNSFWKG